MCLAEHHTSCSVYSPSPALQHVHPPHHSTSGTAQHAQPTLHSTRNRSSGVPTEQRLSMTAGLPWSVHHNRPRKRHCQQRMLHTAVSPGHPAQCCDSHSEYNTGWQVRMRQTQQQLAAARSQFGPAAAETQRGSSRRDAVVLQKVQAPCSTPLQLSQGSRDRI